jgi:hypothetical protein
MNADDFLPENQWSYLDSRIQDVDPRQPPFSPWTGEQLQKHFQTLKTKFALVDECFCCSGNLEARADIDEADGFDGHIRRLLPNDTMEVHTLLLSAFWAFDKKPPKFISRAKPEQDQLTRHYLNQHSLPVENDLRRQQVMWKHWHKLCLP